MRRNVGIIALVMIFACLIPQKALNLDKAVNGYEDIVAVIENYLSNWSYNSYMYEDNDLTVGTVLDRDIDDDVLASVAAEVVMSGEDEDFFGDDISEKKELAIDTVITRLQNNMRFSADKAKYFSEIRQYNGLKRTNFEVSYVVQSLNLRENTAVATVLENISFQYVGVEEPSFGQEEHKVSLVKIDGKWIIVDLETKYDWFADQYKNKEYSIETIISKEKQNIQK